MRRRGLNPSTRWCSVDPGSTAAEVAATALGLGSRGPGPGGWTGSGWPTTSRSRSRTAGIRPTCCPGLDHQDLAGGSLYEIFGRRYGLRLDPPSRPCGARRPTPPSRPGSTPRSHTPLLVFRRVSSRRGAARRVRRLPLPRRPLPGPHGTRAGRPGPGQQQPRKESTSEHTRRLGARERKRFNLAPLQKFGRSLMLPIAALPAAALLLRLGQPDLLGADGLGWDARRRRHRRRRQRALRQPAAAVRGRRRDRHREEGRRLDRAGRRRRLPGLQGGRRRDVAGHPRACPRGREPGADQLRRPRRHRHGPASRAACGSATTGSSCRPTSPSSAVAASCRSSPPSPAIAIAVLMASSTPPSTPASPPSATGSPTTPCSAASSTAP